MSELKEEGVVEKASLQKAVVRVERSSACDHCRSRGACETLSSKSMRVEVANDLGAVEGDRVELSVPATSVLKLSFLVYMIPVAALVAGAYAGDLWAKGREVDPTLAAIIAGALAMLGTFLFLRRIERTVSSPTSDFQPRLSRILPPVSEEDPPPDDSR